MKTSLQWRFLLAVFISEVVDKIAGKQVIITVDKTPALVRFGKHLLPETTIGHLPFRCDPAVLFLEIGKRTLSLRST
jgi:hypothetical protein